MYSVKNAFWKFQKNFFRKIELTFCKAAVFEPATLLKMNSLTSRFKDFS